MDVNHESLPREPLIVTVGESCCWGGFKTTNEYVKLVCPTEVGDAGMSTMLVIFNVPDP
jgi:hypothetical protein